MFEKLGIIYVIVCLPGGQQQAITRETETIWRMHDISDIYSTHGSVVKSAFTEDWFWSASVTQGWYHTFDEAIERLIAEVTEDLA